MTSSNRGRRFPPSPLSPFEIERLLSVVGNGATAKRNVAAIVLMWRGGARCAESLSVRRCDFEADDDGNAVVRILYPKGAGRGKRPRVLGLGKRSVERILPWIATRDAMGISDTAPLCCTLAGKQVSTQYFRELLPRLATRAGIDRRVHAHAFRHTFAFECVQEGQSVPWISKALGHSSITTTLTYLNHLAPADVIDGMQERD